MSSLTLPAGTQLEAGTLQFLSDTRLLWIDGSWTAPLSGKTFPTINPANGQTLTNISLAEAPDVDQAVQAARRAFETTWKRVLPAKRSMLLWKLADLIEANEQVLAELETLDNGKPLEQARADVKDAVKHFRYYAGWPTKIEGSTIPVSAPNKLVYTKREPLGVVGLITPWNFPLAMAAWKLAPALACGNTVVLKPAEQTPLTTLLLGVLAQQAGFPDGVVNIVTGPGQPTGEAISAHADIDKIGFTGSTRVGKQIMEAAARSNLKKVSLELGGKSPNVIFADANLEDALASLTWSSFYNTGQECTLGSRVYVETPVYDQVITALRKSAAGLRIGNGLSNPDLGPLISEVQMQRVLGYIDAGKSQGAKVIIGGERMTGELASGYFMPPTIFTHDDDALRIVQEEIFGPVVVLAPFDGYESAISRANNSIYGLAAAVWTQDIKKAHRFAEDVKAGVVWLNGYDLFDAAAPFGGYKQSGIGREMGKSAIELYTQEKAVWVSL